MGTASTVLEWQVTVSDTTQWVQYTAALAPSGLGEDRLMEGGKREKGKKREKKKKRRGKEGKKEGKEGKKGRGALV